MAATMADKPVGGWHGRIRGAGAQIVSSCHSAAVPDSPARIPVPAVQLP